MTASNESWLCPLGQKEIKYGTTCKDYPECGDTLNINGEIYLRNKQKKSEEVKSIGIAQISDEN